MIRAKLFRATICSICLLAALAAAGAVSGTGVDSIILLSGAVPPSITPAFVLASYERIWRMVAPDRKPDLDKITIIFYTGSRHSGRSVALPEWSGGGAVGRDLIVIPADRTPLPEMDFGRTVIHELTHIALERAYGRMRVPRWFHEGMAMTLSGELSFEEQVSLSRAVFLHRLLPLDSIDFVNRFDRAKATLAYSESHFAAGYLSDKYGMDGIPELLRSVRLAGSFDSAFVQVFGFSTAEFDRMVRDAIAGRYRFMLFFSDTYLLWLPLAVFVIAAFIIIRIRIARRKKLMEEEEREEDARAAGSENGPEHEASGEGEEPQDGDQEDRPRRSPPQ